MWIKDRKNKKENNPAGYDWNTAGKVELSEQLQLRKWAETKFNFIWTFIKSYLF